MKIILIFALTFLISCTNYPLIENTVENMDEAQSNSESNFDKMYEEHVATLEFMYRSIDINSEIKIRILKGRTYEKQDDLLELIYDVQKKKEEQIRGLGKRISEFKSFYNKAKSNFNDYKSMSRDLKNYIKVMGGNQEFLEE